MRRQELGYRKILDYRKITVLAGLGLLNACSTDETSESTSRVNRSATDDAGESSAGSEAADDAGQSFTSLQTASDDGESSASTPLAPGSTDPRSDIDASVGPTSVPETDGTDMSPATLGDAGQESVTAPPPTSVAPEVNIDAGSDFSPACLGDTLVTDVSGVPLGYRQCGDGALHRAEPGRCTDMPRETTNHDFLPADLSLPITAGDVRAAATSDAEGPWLGLINYLSDENIHPDSEVIFECRSNTDCDPGGACVAHGEPEPPPGSYCTYGCVNDSDCSAQQNCDCAGNAWSIAGADARGSLLLLGQCVAADCVTNADCADGALCLRTSHNGDCAWDIEYHCQKPEDECTTDTECLAIGEGDPDLGTEFGCVFAEGRHTCASFYECQAGRPFSVEGSHRVASVVAGESWSRGSVADAPPSASLSQGQRQHLAERWTHIALMEHASVASFARFTLQLLALGAPSPLVAASNQAMRDETRHAQLAFGLASRYAGAGVSAGRLEIRGALQQESLRDITVDTVLQGCIGETAAALEAQLAMSHAQDLSVREVLRQIAADETRHAALAWRFLQWALRRDASLAAEVLEAVEAELRHPRHPASTPAEDWTLTHGIVPRAEQQRLRREVIECVVLPCVKALCASVLCASVSQDGCAA